MAPELAKKLSLLIILLFTIQQFTTVYAVSPPYREGDWFVYQLTVKVAGSSESAKMKLEVVEIDLTRRIVRARAEFLDSSLNDMVRQFFGFLPVVEFSLDDEPSDGKMLINPKYSGTYQCMGLKECTVKYRQGVLTYARVAGEFLFVSFEVTIKLVDSSVLIFSPIRMALILIGVIVVAVVVIIVVVMHIKKKRGVKQQQIQQILTPTPPTGPAPSFPQS